MQRLMTVVRVRPLRLVVGIVVVVVSWQLFILSGVDSRVAPAVDDALTSQDVVSVVVSFAFEAEPFHLRFLQDQGIISRTEPRSVTLRRVSAEGVAAMSRQYWIDRIDLADEDAIE